MAIPLDARDDRSLVLTGGHIGSVDQAVLRAFADQLRLALESRELRQEALEAETLAETAAFAARAAGGVPRPAHAPGVDQGRRHELQQKDVDWSAADQEELLATIDAEADRLDRLVANLLDMSRLQSGALSLHYGAVALEDVVASALSGLSIDGHTEVDVPETVPLVEADPGLLERPWPTSCRTLAWSPVDKPVRAEAAPVGEQVCLRVIDRGPGPSPSATASSNRSAVGDRSNDAGVGLGLAVAQGS